MKRATNIFLNIIIFLIFCLLVIFVVYYFYGSLEMYPTEETQGKTRLVTGFFSIVLILLEICLIRVKIKICKKAGFGVENKNSRT